jgi:DNA-binding MarR family transcriptional regulator
VTGDDRETAPDDAHADGETVRRDAGIERIAADLLPNCSQLVRLVLRRLDDEISRTEGGVLRTLSLRPRRITELAELEGLAQPTMTVLIKRLEERGWVTRARDAADGRVALISITPSGAAALERFRSLYRIALAEKLQAMSADELDELDAAARCIGRLVQQIQT